MGSKRLLHILAAGVLCLAAFSVALSGGGASVHAANCPWMNKSKTPDERARELLAAMSIDDKISIVHNQEVLDQYFGVAGYVPANDALCIPALTLNDAGNGVGDGQVGTTAFPAGIAQSASWDPALQRTLGKAIGWEAWHKGIDVQLAPNVNIARVPMNGRNFEALGEDPFLTGQAGAAEIQGIQENSVIATVKHYALNNQETNRMTSSSDAGERTIREIYTPAFETAVRQGGVGSVMCSYNRLDNVYACENPTFLNQILKGDFGFKDFVMSDWHATHSTVAAANNGLDQEMDVAPGQYFGSALKTAVQAGQVPPSRLDDMVTRILRSMFRIGVFDNPPAAEPGAYAANVTTPAELDVARQVAQQGTVLLKNEGNILPLQGNGKTIAVIGQAAGPVGTTLGYGGGGSSHIPEVGYKAGAVSPLQGIQQEASARGDNVVYADGTAIGDAVAAATTADVAIVFANDAEAEGSDRADLTLGRGGACSAAGCAPGPVDQDQLIQSVVQANPHTIVVLNTGGPVLMPWLAGVKGLLEAWYAGEQDGNAIAPILFGEANPSGKLPQTFPKAMADLPTHSPQQYPGVNDSNGVPHSTYSEGLNVGYRWYDSQGIAPLFPFGFGLSYTTFDLRGMTARAAADGSTAAAVTFNVVNTGQRAGAEVPQLYVGFPASAGEPPKQLKGYTKVSLQPGETRAATLQLDQRAFSFWDVHSHSWKVAPGCYQLMLGRSSRDIVQQGTVALGDVSCPGALARIPIATTVKKCVDTRKFTFALHRARRARIVRVAVYVDGKRRLSLRGRDIRKVTLSRLPAKRFVVKVVSTQSTGSQLISSRIYTGCRKSRPHTKAHHHTTKH